MNTERPAALLAIVILGILLGGLGTCMGCTGVVGQMFNDRMTAFSEQAWANQPPQMAEAQRSMQRQVQAVTDRFRPGLIALGLANMATSLGLLIGGILLLRWHPRGPSIFVAVAVASAVTDALAGGVGLILQQAMGEVMRNAMEGMAGASQVPGGSRLFRGVATGATAASMCFGGFWALLKLSYYGASAFYLRKANVRAMFNPSSVVVSPAL